jgi:hypothetical protein
LGTPDKVILLPFDLLEQYLDSMFSSPDASGGVMHWHVRIRQDSEGFELLTQRDSVGVAISRHVL